MKEKKIQKLREELRKGNYVVVAPNTYVSLLRKAKAPQGLTDEEICKGVILSTKTPSAVKSLQNDIC